MIRKTTLLAIATVMLAGSAAAQGQLALSKAVFVEKIGGSGGLRSITRANNLRKGDRVILLVEWDARGRNANLVVTSAVPAPLAFQGSSRELASVSVDGGSSWGLIGSLRAQSHGNTRLATVEDVTHLRWRVKAGSRGRITYSTIVR